MLFSDIIALVIVYLYVVVIFLLAEKVLKSKPEVSRKFVHIMVGNMIFAMPFFSDPSILLWFITLPITIALFFLTEYSPITIHNSVTESGHALGLFFYAGIWSVLLLIFPILLDPNLLWIVALAIVPLVYGDKNSCRFPCNAFCNCSFICICMGFLHCNGIHPSRA